MTPRKQLFRHDPPHTYGDCRRTALACLLDLEPAEVPHVTAEHWDNPEERNRAELAWLRSRGFALVTCLFQCDLEELFRHQAAMNPGVYFLLAGQGALGVNHQVVACGDGIVCDPSGSGILEPCDDGFYWVEWLVPVSMVRVTPCIGTHG